MQRLRPQVLNIPPLLVVYKSPVSCRAFSFLPSTGLPLYTFMLHLYFGATATVYLTLMEKATLTSPYFLFVFTRRTPGEAVTAVLAPVAITDRAEQFNIDVDTVFADCDTGQYTYVVYEQASSSNTDVTLTGKELERGIVELHPETGFAYTQRTTTTHYIQP